MALALVEAWTRLGETALLADDLAAAEKHFAHAAAAAPAFAHDARALLSKAEAEGLTLVTTEKDAVRLNYTEGPLAALREAIIVIPVRLQFENAQDVQSIIAATLAAWRARRIR